MKKIINYEKDILFKTSIGSISSISLEHDFTVDDGYLRGDFIVSGEYKMNELSINKEPFSYHLPLEYELEPNVDVESLTYDVENFEYNVKGDELSVYIDFGIRYDEKEVEPVIPPVKEIDIDDLILKGTLEDDEEREEEEPTIEEVKEEKCEEVRMDDEDKKTIMNSVGEDDTYVKYHVHIVREGDTLESIASKYNVTVDLIKEYNSCDVLNIKDKIIIPEYNE